ncbi:hypothetical protein GCM10009608_63990 [Pseudonocardia alaniniphila]
MSVTSDTRAPLRRPDRFFIDGEWAAPSSGAMIDVIEPTTEELFFQVAEAREADISAAVAAARKAFDSGPWPRMSHEERAGYLRAVAAAIGRRAEDASQIWPRESGILYATARAGIGGIPKTYEFYADLAADYPFETPREPVAGGKFGLLVREAVGVVGAIIPWNAPMALIAHKLAPALLAGCTVVLKCSPEAPGAGYLMAEIAEEVGLPAGCSTSSRPIARSPNCWCATPASTRSRSPGRRRRGGASPRCAASGSHASRSSWAGSRPR